MKITFVTSSLSAGGAERVVSHLANYLCAANYQVDIVIFQDVCQYNIDQKIRLHKLIINERGAMYVIKAALALRHELKHIAPDIILSFITNVNIYSILACIATKRKLIVSERVDPARTPLPYKIMRSLLYPFTSGIVFQTKLAQQYFGYRIQKRSIVIHNPVIRQNESQFSNETCKRHDIVGVGRLTKQKNFSLLIKAYAQIHNQMPDMKLVIYGEGSERSYLVNLCKVLQVEDFVFFPGLQDDIPSKIQNAKMFVLSSDYEGMSNALMEAMSVGLPCISTDCPIGGSSELIINGVNGILVPVGDQTALANAMLSLYKNDILLKSLSDEAKNINETHSLEKIAEQWMNYIRTIK